MRSVAAVLKPVSAGPFGPGANIKTPAIFAVHHTSVFDALWLLQSLPKFMADETLYLTEAIPYPWFPYTFYRHHTVMLDKRDDPLEILKTSLAVVHSGKNLITFPEGKLSSAERPGELKTGIGLLARETKATIIPVKKIGACMRFGDPFTFADAVARGALTSDASPQEIAEYIRQQIIAL